MGAEYSSYVKFIANETPKFFGYIISVLANVYCQLGYGDFKSRAQNKIDFIMKMYVLEGNVFFKLASG